MALTPDEIDGLRELILAVYGPVTEELLRDLCRCIAAAGQISSGDEYKLLLAKSLAGADDVIADTLRRQTDLTDDAVAQLMRWAAEKTAPLEENESLHVVSADGAGGIHAGVCPRLLLAGRRGRREHRHPR